MWVWAHECRCPHRLDTNFRSSGDGAADGGEVPNVGVFLGNHLQWWVWAAPMAVNWGSNLSWVYMNCPWWAILITMLRKVLCIPSVSNPCICLTARIKTLSKTLWRTNWVKVLKENYIKKQKFLWLKSVTDRSYLLLPNSSETGISTPPMV